MVYFVKDRLIDDLRKSRGLNSVRAFGHGPVYIGIRNADQALTVRGEHADRIAGSPS